MTDAWECVHFGIEADDGTAFAVLEGGFPGGLQVVSAADGPVRVRGIVSNARGAKDALRRYFELVVLHKLDEHIMGVVLLPGQFWVPVDFQTELAQSLAVLIYTLLQTVPNGFKSTCAWLATTNVVTWRNQCPRGRARGGWQSDWCRAEETALSFQCSN